MHLIGFMVNYATLSRTNEILCDYARKAMALREQESNLNELLKFRYPVWGNRTFFDEQGNLVKYDHYQRSVVRYEFDYVLKRYIRMKTVF